jgi:pimeloyl-ACP methyl ester carboxylesterase
MPVAPRHALQWSVQSNNYIPDWGLPSNTTRHFVQTPQGHLELLVVDPPATHPRREQALFFQHGAFGCASVWLPYTTYLSRLGYPCYALSLRGHGASWVPGMAALWCTTKAILAQDMIAGLEWTKVEEMRKRDCNTANIVLVGHSIGGGLVQYALSEELVTVTGLILCAPAPGSGL